MTGARVAGEASADAVGVQQRDRSTLASEATAPRVRVLDNAERSRLDLPLANFARILSSEVALYYQLDSMGQLLTVICSWGVGPRHEPITRPHARGIVGRALGAERALERLADNDDIAPVDSAREMPMGATESVGATRGVVSTRTPAIEPEHDWTRTSG